MKRRDFLKCGIAGITVLSFNLAGCGGSGGGGGSSGALNPGGSTVEVDGVGIEIHISEVLQEMVDGTLIYSWAFGELTAGPGIPGPVIKATEGEEVSLYVTNDLTQNHAFAIPGVIESGIIEPGKRVEVSFTAPAAGTYLYYDPLNAPVNRVLGLHGAMVVLPILGNTPYSNPTAAVQKLFDDLGTTAHFPKNASSPAGWQRDRSQIWLMSQIDPAFNSLAQQGSTIDPGNMRDNFLPRYFTINGRSGVFASHDPTVLLSGRIGQPMLVRILNAGLFFHSNHLHANHFYVTSKNNVVQENVFSIDSLTIAPEDRIDWVVPFVRPPDIPGNQNIPLRDLIPNELALTIDGNNGVPQSPLGYPMHCHAEMSQTAAGGNYPQGTVTHFDFLGDIDGIDFPNVGH